MKTYTKPRMLTLSLSANDMLCLGCSAQTRFDQNLSNLLFVLAGISDQNANGIFDKEDAAKVSLFSTTDGCENKLDYQGYCKFTADSTVLFTS